MRKTLAVFMLFAGLNLAAGEKMQNFKWQISKRLKQAMRERDIDNLALVRRTDELYLRSHPGHDEDMRAEVYAVLDEYAPNVDIEIFDLVCKVLDVKIELG